MHLWGPMAHCVRSGSLTLKEGGNFIGVISVNHWGLSQRNVLFLQQ